MTKKYLQTYLVTGVFEIYDRYGILITNQKFLNKKFEAPFPKAAKNKALAYLKTRATKKYGKGTTVNQVSNIKVKKTD